MTSPATPLSSALGKTEQVEHAVGHAADELLVINTVLQQEIAPAAKTPEVAQALHKSDQLETKLSESAADLAEVTGLLAQEVEERRDLEQELKRTQAALQRARS